MFGLLRLLGLVAFWEYWKKRDAFQRVANLLPGLAAAGIAMFMLFAVSKALLTVDAIQNPTIRMIYAVFIVLLFTGLAGFLFFYYRKPRASLKPQPPTRERLEALYAKHGVKPASLGKRPALLFGGRRAAETPAIAICGVAGGGKDNVAAALAEAAAKSGAALNAAIVALPDISVWARENAEIAEMAGAAAKIVVVADQDLRSYEIDFVKAALAYDKPVIIAIDQPQPLSPRDREAIETSITKKFAAAPLKPPIIFTRSQPQIVNALVVGADGLERQEERLRPADVATLLREVAR